MSHELTVAWTCDFCGARGTRSGTGDTLPEGWTFLEHDDVYFDLCVVCTSEARSWITRHGVTAKASA